MIGDGIPSTLIHHPKTKNQRVWVGKKSPKNGFKEFGVMFLVEEKTDFAKAVQGIFEESFEIFSTTDSTDPCFHHN